jgi:hypothetical protein
MQNKLFCDSDIARIHNKQEGTIIETDLLNLLRRRNLRDGLITLGKCSYFIFNCKDENKIGRTGYRDPKTGVIFTQFQIAYLANLFIISRSNDYKSEQIITKQNLLTLCNAYNNLLIQPELVRPDNQKMTHDEFITSLVRLNTEQLEYQFDPALLIARTLIFFNEIIKDNPPNKFESFSIIFERETGLTFEEYFTLAMVVLASVQKLPAFKKEFLTQATIPTLKDILTDQKVTNFLNILSINYPRFKEEDEKFNTHLDPALTKYRFNPLNVYPIIQTDKTDNSPYVVPNILCLIKKSFGGLYWWFHCYFEEIGLQKEFRTYFGSVFEQYVGIILKQIYTKQNVHPEITYAKDNKKFIDWYVENDSKIYFFEAKAYQFPLNTKISGDTESIYKEINSKIIKSIKQVYSRILEIDKYDELKLFKGKEIHTVIIFLDMPLISTHLYRELINKELEDAENNGYSGITKANIHLLNIEELEVYQSAVKIIPIEEVFERYKDTHTDGFTTIIQKAVEGSIRSEYLEGIYKDYWKKLVGDAYQE